MNSQDMTVPDESEMLSQKERILLLSVVTTFFSLIPTAYVTFISNSITLLADFMRCAVEHLSILLAWIVLKRIHAGGKHEFNFGYGKLERLSSFIVAVAMFLTILILCSSSWFRFLEPVKAENVFWGFGLSLLSVLGNSYLWYKNYQLAEISSTPIIESQRILFRAKTMASLIVVISLGLGIIFAGASWVDYLDPLGSLCIALYLVPSMKGLFSDSITDLIDQTLEESYQLQIMKTLVSYDEYYMGLDKVRTRKSGAKSYIQLHLLFDKQKTIGEVESFVLKIIAELQEKIPNSEVTVVSRQG